MEHDAHERDHKKLGKELDLFTFSDAVGKGLPLWTPKCAVIRRELERFIVDEEIKRGYLHVYTPDIAKLDLYRKSGHYPHYKDSMYAPIQVDDEEFMLRPMTCPHHFELYLAKPHSYRELPMRIAELAKLYRYEQSGELMGLQRVRSFCLADAHIICATEEQAAEEVAKALDLIVDVAKVFGLVMGENYHFRLSLGDRSNTEKYFRDDAAWEKGEHLLREVLKARGEKFEEAKDEAAFYGPKIDIQMKNVNGKEDTAFTVQYDFCMPTRRCKPRYFPSLRSMLHTLRKSSRNSVKRGFARKSMPMIVSASAYGRASSRKSPIRSCSATKKSRQRLRLSKVATAAKKCSLSPTSSQNSSIRFPLARRLLPQRKTAPLGAVLRSLCYLLPFSRKRAGAGSCFA
ncbi:MAG: threonyl-tRNA synthetase [Parcubacteria group bacterium Athens0416_74]|nr:MAG: threonyl-tRNA synthetase [Parcubacteria group bacterium Athens0416_74]